MGQALKKPSEKVNDALKDAIVYIGRTNVRTAIKQELKGIGLQGHIAETKKDCLSLLSMKPQAMLVIEWREDKTEVASILRAAQGKFGIDTRPIYMIAPDVDETIIASLVEYNVARIHSGDISKATIVGHLQVILNDEGGMKNIRPSMIRVAEARGRGDWATAGIILRELRSIYPNDTRIVLELADNFIQEERWEEASGLLNDLVANNEMNLRAKHLLARVFMRERRYSEAAKVLEEANLISPYNVDRLVDLGKVFLKVHRVKEAMQSFDLALQIDETNREANMGKSQCMLIEGDINEALSLLKQVSGPRETASVFNNAAVLSIHQGRFEEGLNLYRSAIGTVGKVQRLVARLLFNMGIGYFKWGQIEKAFECFEKAASLDLSFDKAIHNAKYLASQLGKKVTISLSDAAQPQVVSAEDKELISEFNDDLSSEDEGLLG